MSLKLNQSKLFQMYSKSKTAENPFCHNPFLHPIKSPTSKEITQMSGRIAPESQTHSTNSHVKLPSLLRKYISPEKWKTMSKQRQNECKQIFRAPNTYFFRNRPSWETLRFGSFSKEEEKQFFDRFHAFQSMGIVNAQWGFFAIPFIGRVGYQLSTYYRTQVKLGVIKDDSFIIDATGKMRQVKHKQKIEMNDELNHRMYTETAELLSTYASTNTNAQTPKQQTEKVKQPKEKSSEVEITDTTPSAGEITYQQQEADDEQDPNSSNSIGSDDVKSSTMPKKIQDQSPQKPMKTRERPHKRIIFSDSNDFEEDQISFESIHKGRRRKVKDHDNSDQELHCIITGARDPLTGRPMRHPAMNNDGYVMDLDSWKLVLTGKEPMPFDTAINSLRDLTLVTSKTYEELKMYIVNVPM